MPKSVNISQSVKTTIWTSLNKNFIPFFALPVLVMSFAHLLSITGANPISNINVNANPGGVGSNLVLWLDAADSSTLTSDTTCSSNVTSDGNKVQC